MKSMSFTVFSYNATVLLIQPNPLNPSHVLENATRPNPTQPMDGPNPCTSLSGMHQNASFSTTVVCVELARPVGGTVVVRVTDRRQRAVQGALQAHVHADRVRHFVDHLPSRTTCPLPACTHNLFLVLYFGGVAR